MASDALINFTFAGLPANYCFTSYDRFALDIAAGLQGFLPGNYSTFVVSQAEPDVADRDKVWIQLDSNGLPTGRIFTYIGGWFQRHPRRDEAGKYLDERVWWVGTEADAWSFDGGDGTDPSTTPPTTTTGAMWERDTDFDFRFPLAAGTSPKPTTVSIGDTGGEEEHTLTSDEVAKHTHLCWPADGGDGNAGRQWSHQDPGGESDTGDITKSIVPNDDNTAKTTLQAVAQSDGDAAHNNMPPYRVGVWLKPTIRGYYSP